MSALTLAVEAMPTALAAYNRKEVLAVIPLASPREALKSALKLTQNITIVEPSENVLQSTEFRRLKRSTGQLEQVKTETASLLNSHLHEGNNLANLTYPHVRSLKPYKGILVF